MSKDDLLSRIAALPVGHPARREILGDLRSDPNRLLGVQSVRLKILKTKFELLSAKDLADDVVAAARDELGRVDDLIEAKQRAWVVSGNDADDFNDERMSPEGADLYKTKDWLESVIRLYENQVTDQLVSMMKLIVRVTD